MWSTNSYRQKTTEYQVEEEMAIHIIEYQVVRDTTKWKGMHLKTIMNLRINHLEAEWEESQCQEDQFHILVQEQEEMITVDQENRGIGDKQTTINKTNMNHNLEVEIKIITSETKQSDIIKNTLAMKNNCKVNKQQSQFGGDEKQNC